MTTAMPLSEAIPATRPSDARERELLARIAARDRQAMREFYLIYHRRLARFLSRLTSRYEVVEEIINDTLVVVWQKAADFRGDSRVSTWIIGIAYRRGLKSLRAERRADESMQMPLPRELSLNDESAAQAESEDWLGRALSQLPTEQRAVLELTYYLGYSCEEIARIMECPVNTVKTRMFHARQKLRVALPVLATPEGET
jgi:RNA polymerase sigma-70 factor, ECF subfamily